MIAEIVNSLYDLKCWKSSEFYILLVFNHIPEIISTKFIMKAIISVYNSSYIHEKHKSCLKTLIQQLFAHSIDDREFAENAFYLPKRKIFRTC